MGTFNQQPWVKRFSDLALTTFPFHFEAACGTRAGMSEIEACYRWHPSETTHVTAYWDMPLWWPLKWLHEIWPVEANLSFRAITIPFADGHSILFCQRGLFGIVDLHLCSLLWRFSRWTKAQNPQPSWALLDTGRESALFHLCVRFIQAGTLFDICAISTTFPPVEHQTKVNGIGLKQ
jgi:hypothetical protein